MHCVAPWVNIHIQVDGNIRPCCGMGEDFNLIQDGQDYLNNKKLIEIKKNLNQNILHRSCQGCQEKHWYEEFEQSVSNFDPVQFHMKSIDARWSNLCNLTCTYCVPGFSSSWEKLVFKNNEKSRRYKSEIENVFKLITANLSTIERVSLVGGEPLLLKENQELLKILPDHIRVEIITNLSVDLDKSPVYELLSKRNAVNWYISMENVGDQFEFVRRGAKWQEQVSNLHRLEEDTISLNHLIRLQSNFCAYSATNILDLYQFVDQFKKVGISWAANFTDPEPLNFYHYPAELKEQSIQQINQVIETLKHERNDEVVRLKEIINRMCETDEVPGIVMSCIDFHRKQESQYFNNEMNFSELWPQYKG